MILGDLDFITHQGFPSSPARLPSWRPRLVGLISAQTPQQTACPDSSCVPSSSSRFSLVGPGSHPSPLLRHRESPCLSSLRNWLRLRHCWGPTPSLCLTLSQIGPWSVPVSSCSQDGCHRSRHPGSCGRQEGDGGRGGASKSLPYSEKQIPLKPGAKMSLTNLLWLAREAGKPSGFPGPGLERLSRSGWSLSKPLTQLLRTQTSVPLSVCP